MTEFSGHYQYSSLGLPTAFRVAELLPGKTDDSVCCLLHHVERSKLLEYEAISYAWGDPNEKVPVIVHGKTLQVTRNLWAALTHFRYEDRSRFVWADALCINQTDIPERGSQVKQMRKIFEMAKAVLIWLGPDNETHQAAVAIATVQQMSTFLCKILDVPFDQLSSEEEIYHNIIFKNRHRIPLPHGLDFVSDDMWDSLLWLYKHPYFTGLWAIQEVNANSERIVHCGKETIQWNAIELVAGYIIMETSFSKSRGFTDAYCWWASTAPSELRQAQNWLHMLYLASNFASTDPRDVIYGLRGMIDCKEGGHLLDPDYAKETVDVYRDSVEAAFINYKTTNALAYVSGVKDPSWVPRWDQPMLFRNPFRFGKTMPWKPAGDSQPEWSIDRKTSTLSLTGMVHDTIDQVELYRETLFGNAMFSSAEGREELRRQWRSIFRVLANVFPVPLSNSVLTAVATSFSFGLDDKCDVADESLLFRNFAAYLRNVLDDETYKDFISAETTLACEGGNGDAFGKPVWDFEYPVASFFITKGKSVGCSIASSTPGDIAYVPLGSVYPLVLRPHGKRYRVRGFCFVHGIMQGETKDGLRLTVDIV